jgi:hypothetical protein
MAVRPNPLDAKAVEATGAKESAEPEDLFGDKDSDDEDPTVTSMLESRSVSVAAQGVLANPTVDSALSATPTIDSAATQVTMGANMEGGGAGIGEVRLSQKRDREE